MSRRNFLLTAGIVGVGLAEYAGTHARHALEVTSLEIQIKNLPDPFVGFRIVQISDIHLEEYTEPWFLQKVIEKVNGLKPDLVLFTGDLISYGPAPFSVSFKAAGIGAEILSEIKAPQRFAILGNHDAYIGAHHIIEPLESHGTTVLNDRYIPIERRGEKLWLCGTKDIIHNHPDLDKAMPGEPKAPVILMAHEPDFVDYVVQHPRGKMVDLMLSGHTHGGQVRLPAIGPLTLPPLGRKYVQGLFKVNNTQLYVNRGVGTVGLPFRMNCSPEITQITLARL